MYFLGRHYGKPFKDSLHWDFSSSARSPLGLRLTLGVSRGVAGVRRFHPSGAEQSSRWGHISDPNLLRLSHSPASAFCLLIDPVFGFFFCEHMIGVQGSSKYRQESGWSDGMWGLDWVEVVKPAGAERLRKIIGSRDEKSGWGKDTSVCRCKGESW